MKFSLETAFKYGAKIFMGFVFAVAILAFVALFYNLFNNIIVPLIN